MRRAQRSRRIRFVRFSCRIGRFHARPRGVLPSVAISPRQHAACCFTPFPVVGVSLTMRHRDVYSRDPPAFPARGKPDSDPSNCRNVSPAIACFPDPAESAKNRTSSLQHENAQPMEPRFTLAQMRDVWIDAYRHADVEQLDFVASPHFFVRHEARIRPKAQFLARMRVVAAERTPDRPAIAYRDETMQIVTRGRCATITGIGSVRIDQAIDSRFDFVEQWCVIDARWRIAALWHEHK